MGGSGRASARGARLLAVFCAAWAPLVAMACRGGSDSRSRPFPSWEERVLHAWTNRARADPGAELADCRECGERACYSPAPPLEWSLPLNRAARFHADEMQRQDFFFHDSRCRIGADIDALYPHACDGSESCACQGRGPMRWSERLELFRVARPSGEVQAEHRDDPDSTFYYLLHEPASSRACASGAENGHRWNLLKQMGTVGFGVNATHTVGDFSRSRGRGHPVPSGAHYPRQAETVEFWASWYAPAGPSAALVNVDGACTALKLTRGGPANGAWSASLSGLGGGCRRYLFLFRDASGVEVTHPETGSFGLGPEATCPDWDESRPANGPTCS